MTLILNFFLREKEHSSSWKAPPSASELLLPLGEEDVIAPGEGKNASMVEIALTI